MTHCNIFNKISLFALIYVNNQIRRQFGTQPWMNRHYTVNNFEHRFTAQQKLLKEQLSEIKEQKRLIQEMMFTQQQQILKQQLPGQHGSSTSPGQDQLFSDHDRNSTSKSGPEGRFWNLSSPMMLW